MDKIIITSSGGWDYELDGKLFGYLTAMEYLQYTVGLTSIGAGAYLFLLETELKNNKEIGK